MGYKMSGWSPFTQKGHPKKTVPPEHKDLDVTRGRTGSKAFDVNEDATDIEDRIEFLKESVNAGDKTQAEVNPMIKKLEAALAKLDRPDPKWQNADEVD